jgi:hypothetical protein
VPRNSSAVDEGAEEDGLADARLAGDEDHRPVTGDRPAGTLLEHVEGMLALQQPHSGDCRRRGRL